MPDKRVLILGGTGEARQLADRAVAALPGHVEIISSYAGRTERPADPPGTVREGGFGGADGLADYLRDAGIDLVIDATHPFAAAISTHAAIASETVGCPRLTLSRPDWVIPDDARVTEAADMAEAARLVAAANHVFLSTGTQDLEAFADLQGPWFLVRLITAPENPLPLQQYAITTGRPPFDLEAETALLRDHRIDVIVSKHSGGALPAKITAAASLGLPVVLIRQPPQPPGERTETIDGAMAWIRERL